MTKRTDASNEVPPAKRSRRAPGFHLARPAPIPSESQPSSSSTTSLFVTVSQSDERPGTLTAQNRVLTSTHGPSTSSSTSPSSLEALLPQAIEPDTEIQDEPIIQGDPIPQVQQPDTVKPKRKRNTTNAVCYPPGFCA
jgi:hypothetical protein